MARGRAKRAREELRMNGERKQETVKWERLRVWKWEGWAQPGEKREM